MNTLALLLAVSSTPASEPANEITLAPTVIIVNPPKHATTWTCSAPQDLVQGSGTVRVCSFH